MGWWAGVPVGWLAGGLVCRWAGGLVACGLVGWLTGWLAGWLVTCGRGQGLLVSILSEYPT